MTRIKYKKMIVIKDILFMLGLLSVFIFINYFPYNILSFAPLTLFTIYGSIKHLRDDVDFE